MLYQMIIIFPSAINQVLAIIAKKGIDVQVSVNSFIESRCAKAFSICWIFFKKNTEKLLSCRISHQLLIFIRRWKDGYSLASFRHNWDVTWKDTGYSLTGRHFQGPIDSVHILPYALWQACFCWFILRN